MEEKTEPEIKKQKVSNSVDDSYLGELLQLEANNSNSDTTAQTQTKAESKNSLTNGSGQKLESIIGRLCLDKAASQPSTDNRADAGTQTAQDFVKIVNRLVLKRMKQLEHSLIGGAVADSVLNGKLAELHRENKELRDKTRKLQEKIEILSQLHKGDNQMVSAKSKEPNDNTAIQGMPAEGETISPIRRQSAVVSPYNVHGSQGEIHQDMVSQLESNRLRDLASRHVSNLPSQTLPGLPASCNSTKQEQRSCPASLNTLSYHPVSHQGPQVKYVPHKLQGNSVLPGGSGPQLIHLGPGKVVMQNMHPQHQHISSAELGNRISGHQVIYTTQPVQVTGPRMSTLPPQPLQMKQQLSSQRPMLSPTQIRLGQAALPPGGPARLQGPVNQAVPIQYVPQGVISGYMTPVQNFTPDNRRLIAQGPNSREFRSQVSPAGRNMAHHLNEFRARSAQLPPPYAPISRSQGEMQTPPKLQVNITVSDNGIVLSWDFEAEPIESSPAVECYHLFASQDSPNPPTSRSDWKKIGVVKALPLPMACTLTQFVSGNSYHFAVLAVDVHGREGPMSNPCTVRLNK